MCLVIDDGTPFPNLPDIIHFTSRREADVVGGSASRPCLQAFLSDEVGFRLSWIAGDSFNLLDIIHFTQPPGSESFSAVSFLLSFCVTSSSERKSGKTPAVPVV